MTEKLTTGQKVVVVNRHGRHEGTIVRVRSGYVTISYGPNGCAADDFWTESRKQVGYKGDAVPVFEFAPGADVTPEQVEAIAAILREGDPR